MIHNKFTHCPTCGAKYLGKTHKCVILPKEKLEVTTKKEK
jgi:hypothetical protein